MNIESLKWQQANLAKKVVLEDGFGKIKCVGGFDIAYSGKRFFCSAVVYDWEKPVVIEYKTLMGKEKFPYVTEFLAFREAPNMIGVYNSLRTRPDVLLIDGQGICHPRGMGLASHVGVLLDKPTIGIAKSRLCGDYKEPSRGGIEGLFLEGRQVGWVLRQKSKPIFISPGHKVSVKSCLKIVLHCMQERRLPEPLRLAHLYAKEAKNNYENR